jgi:hypothetical protein
MTFAFDTKGAAKRQSASANPAKAANPSPQDQANQQPISGISSFSSSKGRDQAWDYTPADLAEMDKKLRELAELESWSASELDGLLDELRRMAPCNVRAALVAIRKAHESSLGVWPKPPATRSRFTLCRLRVIDGGKS